MADDVKTWLRSLGLEKYADLFEEQEISLAAVDFLTEEDLRELGLPIGPRRILQSAIAARSKPVESSQNPNESKRLEPRSAERRQLTILFCDLVGSTALAADHDPEDLRDILRRYHEAVAEAAQRFGGYIAKYMGDGVLAYFGWPQASEDQTANAVRAGLLAVQSVSALPVAGSSPMAARVGIASGRVVVGDLIGDRVSDLQTVTGETPNLAARLQSLAEAGDVVIDDRTCSLIGGQFQCLDMGPRELKGFAKPLQVWRVLGELATRNRFDDQPTGTVLPLIGRTFELGLVNERWGQACAGNGQTVHLVGEAGIGKSHFARAVRDQIRQGDHFRLVYQCSAHHRSSALHPVIEQIRHSAGFEPDDSADQQLDRLESLIERYTPEQVDTIPLLAALLALPFEHRFDRLELTAQRQRELTISTILDHILALSRQQPVLLVVEDAHWIDPTTEALIDTLVHRAADVPLLILISSRTEYRPPWSDFANQARVYLNRLTPDQGAEVVAASGGALLPADVQRAILSRSDGVPLYIEELTKASLEEGATQTIPASLEASLTARIDRLGDAKRTAQLASVLGRAFDLDILEAVDGGEPEQLQDALGKMLGAGLLVRSSQGAREAFRFKHALIQDAAYQTLLRSSRRQYHGRVAEFMVHLAEDERRYEPEIIAWHFSRSGDFGSAVRYWLIAGQRLGKGSAHSEALTVLQSGLDDLSNLPETADRDSIEFDLRIALGASLMTVKGWSAKPVADNYRRAKELCEATGDVTKLFMALRGQANVLFLNGRVEQAKEIVDRLVEIAEQGRSTELPLQAYLADGMCQLFTGYFGPARARLDQAFRLYDQAEHHALAFVSGTDPAVVSLVSRGWAEWLLGEPEAARASSGRAIELATQLKHPFSLVYAQCLTASLYQFSRRPELVIEFADAAIENAKKNHYPYWLGWATMMRGWAVAALGDTSAGIEILEEGLDIYEGTGAVQIKPYCLTMLAEMYGWNGQPKQGFQILQPVLERDDGSDVDFYRAETGRVAGELAAASDRETAKSCFADALSTAQKQGAGILELRIAASLARHDLPVPGKFDTAAGIEALCKAIDPQLEEPDIVELLSAMTVA